MFLSHIDVCLSVSLPLSLPLSLKSIKQTLGGGLKKKKKKKQVVEPGLHLQFVSLPNISFFQGF